MDEDSVTQYILNTFEGVETATAQGYTFFFYGPDRKLPFVTLATQNNEYDRASQLDRPSVFRLNIGVSRNTYRSLFGTGSPRLGPDGVVDTGHDFTLIDQLMPHPIYVPQSWVCVLNPMRQRSKRLSHCWLRRIIWLLEDTQKHGLQISSKQALEISSNILRTKLIKKENVYVCQ